MANLYNKSILITNAWEGDLEALKLMHIDRHDIDDVIECAYSNHNLHVVKYLFEHYSHYCDYISTEYFVKVFHDAFQRFDLDFIKLLIKNLQKQYIRHWIIEHVYQSLLDTSHQISKSQATAIYDIFADAGMKPIGDNFSASRAPIIISHATNMNFLYLFTKNGAELNFIDNGKIYAQLFSDNMNDDFESIKNKQLQRFYKKMKKSRNSKLQQIDETLPIIPCDVLKIVHSFIPFENDFNFINATKEKIITLINFPETIIILLILLIMPLVMIIAILIEIKHPEIIGTER